MPAKVILQVVSGPIQGQAFVFEHHDTFIFGRHRDSHARLPSDPRVSRHHFLLEVNPPAARIRDLGSRNGTRVNGTKYGGRALDESPEQAAHRTFPEVDLKTGDQITVGNTRISVDVELPECCRECGQEIPGSNRMAAEDSATGLVCEACRLRRAVAPPRFTILEAPVCSRCGKLIFDEHYQSCQGECYCRDCQTDLSAGGDPLRRLLCDAMGRGGHQPPPVDPDKYELGEELGKGGQGVVYKAIRRSDRQAVAVKVMLPKMAVDEEARKRFLREIDVAVQLRHNHVVQLLDRGVAGPAFFFVMEYCSGGNVWQCIKRKGGRLPLPIAAQIMNHCLDGLDHMHRAGYVHRDLKPQNILLNGKRNRWEAKISDLGLAKLFAEAGWSGFTAIGSVGGTFDYMPREQLTHFRDFRPVSDLWSITAMFYCMLTGQCPRDFPPKRDRVEVILHDDAVPIRQRDPAIPKGLANVVDRALATDPSKRFQTAAELKRALDKATRGGAP